jgi:hypothetical protein
MKLKETNEQYQKRIRKEEYDNNQLGQKKMFTALTKMTREFLLDIKNKGFIKDDMIERYDKEYLDVLEVMPDEVFK